MSPRTIALSDVAAKVAGSDLSPSEKEERQVERLIHKRPAPSRKRRPKRGPKHDNRRRRMKVDDPDVSKSDPDMSLNRKTQGSIAFAAVKVVLAADVEDLEEAVSKFEDELKDLSPALARAFAQYADSQHVEWVREGWADPDALKKEIKEIKSFSSQFRKRKKAEESRFLSAGADDVADVIASSWPSGHAHDWVGRAAVLSALMAALDDVKLPASYKVPFMRGSPSDALQDRKLLRRLIESSGSVSGVSEDELFRFSQLASAYKILKDNPESVDAASMRSSIDKMAEEIDEQSQELLDLGEILDSWTSMLKDVKPSDSKPFKLEDQGDYNRVLNDLDHFFGKSDMVDPTPLMEELEEYTRTRFKRMPPELEGLFEGFGGGAASNEHGDEAMSKRVATYHGVVDQRGNPVQTTNTGYKSFHSRNFTEENYKAILAYAQALLDEPWLKYGWDGGKKDAQYRAALDLAIHLADDNLYQAKIDVDTYNLLYARLAKTDQDTFSETVIPVQEKVGQKRSAAEMRKRQEYQAIVRIASDLRDKNPVAALGILKNLRELVATDAAAAESISAHVALEDTQAVPGQTAQDLAAGCHASGEDDGAEAETDTAGVSPVAVKPGEDIEFRSMGDDDFRKLKDELHQEVNKLFNEDDVQKFLNGFEGIISEIEERTASSIGGGVPLEVLVKLAASSAEAKRLLGPVIVAAAKKKTSKGKTVSKDKKDDSGKPFGGKGAPPFGGKGAPPFGGKGKKKGKKKGKGKKRKATLTVGDLNW